MKKTFIIIGILLALVFIFSDTTYAFSFVYGDVFGGKITNTKASEVQDLENQGYQCVINGSTITINPLRGVETYFIPTGTTSKTGNTPATGQWIMGRYGGQSTITCTKQCGETTCTDIVILDTITMFATSLR